MNLYRTGLDQPVVVSAGMVTEKVIPSVISGIITGVSMVLIMRKMGKLSR